MKPKREPVPYANATSGAAARDEVTRMLRRFGCEAIGFLDNYAKHEVTLYFDHKGRRVQMQVSAAGWAALYLRTKPWTGRGRGRTSKADYEAKALAQGLIAASSILRDWVKGQLTAVECGVLSFDAVFLSHMVLKDGRTVLEHATERNMLPPPTGGVKDG